MPKKIYIPLCFYLYRHHVIIFCSSFIIYIPLCFYLYVMLYSNNHQTSYLHSTMFLLILATSQRKGVNYINLHSTMFLLIRYGSENRHKKFAIYIPLCFYLYSVCHLLLCSFSIIYIPLCFYLYKDTEYGGIIGENLHSTMFLLIQIRKMQFPMIL